MSRPEKQAEDRRKGRSVALSDTEHAAHQARAEAAGQTLSQWRRAALNAAAAPPAAASALLHAQATFEPGNGARYECWLLERPRGCLLLALCGDAYAVELPPLQWLRKMRPEEAEHKARQAGMRPEDARAVCAWLAGRWDVENEPAQGGWLGVKVGP